MSCATTTTTLISRDHLNKAAVLHLSSLISFPECLKSGAPSAMVGDVFFNFTCSGCAEDGQEDVKRMKMQWCVAGWPTFILKTLITINSL